MLTWPGIDQAPDNFVRWLTTTPDGVMDLVRTRPATEVSRDEVDQLLEYYHRLPPDPRRNYPGSQWYRQELVGGLRLALHSRRPPVNEVLLSIRALCLGGSYRITTTKVDPPIVGPGGMIQGWQEVRERYLDALTALVFGRLGNRDGAVFNDGVVRDQLIATSRRLRQDREERNALIRLMRLEGASLTDIAEASGMTAMGVKKLLDRKPPRVDPGHPRP